MTAPGDALLDAWRERRRAAFSEVCAEDLHWEDPFCTEPLYGPVALADHAAQLWNAVPDLRVERAGDPLADGRFTAIPVRLSGTHLVELAGIPPTGRSLAIHAVLYCELDPPRERIWRVRVFLDGYDAAVQVGILPRRGSLAERALLAFRGFGLRREKPGVAEGGPPATTP